VNVSGDIWILMRALIGDVGYASVMLGGGMLEGTDGITVAVVGEERKPPLGVISIIIRFGILIKKPVI
jgi:hypothetical protein